MNRSGNQILSGFTRFRRLHFILLYAISGLAAYNAGHLHGAYDELDDIKTQINEMLAASPVGFAEEYAIHDYEGFGGYALSEYEGIETAHEIACFITGYQDFGGKLLNNFGGDLEEATIGEVVYACISMGSDSIDYKITTWYNRPL